MLLFTFLMEDITQYIIILIVTQGKRGRSEYPADFLCILQVEITTLEHT